MVNIYNISINYKLKSYKITLGSERRLQSCGVKNLNADGASTSATEGEACLTSFFILVILLI
jgi:hypothetical protein